MPYIGRGPVKNGAFQILDDVSGSFNGSTTSFALTVGSVALIAGAPETLSIAVDGVMQEPGTAYTISGSNIVFGSAPAAESSFWGVELGDVGGLVSTAATQSVGDNSTNVATTAYVISAVATENTIDEMDDTTITSVADGEILRWNGSAWVNNTLSEAGLVSYINVTQNGHGFSVGEALKVTSTNNVYAKAQADTAANAEVVGVVTTSATNTFTLTLNGEIATGGNISAANAASGTVLFLSHSTPGALSATEPSTAGQISKPVAIVTAQNANMVLLPYRGDTVGTGVTSWDVNGVELVLDVDGDTSLTADTDDQIDVKISGADDFRFTANNFNILSGSTLTVDSGATITNSGTATGFGVTLAGSTNNTIVTVTSANALTGEGNLTFNGSVLTVTGNILPGANNTHDLGSGSYQWRNIYTQDFHLNNTLRDEGNSIDGTKGNWTIQEGDENLFIVNNKTGKKYKFHLTEVA